MAERASRVQELVDKGVLNVAYGELQRLRQEIASEQYESEERTRVREWLRERMAAMDARIVQSMSDKRHEYLKQLEVLEVEAGTQVMDEARRTLQFLGKQFLLESDLDERDLTYSRKGTANMMLAASMKKSQIFDLARRGTRMMASRDAPLKQIGRGF